MPPRRGKPRQRKVTRTPRARQPSKEHPMQDSQSQPSSGHGGFDEEHLIELHETAEAVEKLARDAENFRRVVDAFRAQNVDAFQGGLAAAGVLEWCHLVCRWLCSKHCVFVCVKLCGPLEEPKELDVE